MRKRLISVCIVVILVSGIFGCIQTAEVPPAGETESLDILREIEEYSSSILRAGYSDILYSTMEKEYSQSEKEKGSDKDITWDAVDYNVVDLHFHFEDGTVIDREIVAYSVQDILYQDITGDDIDEVLLYCDFVNNTCDWQLIYFYQIDQGNVTDISPSGEDIPEINNADWGLWNMWIAFETMEGYSSPVYKLEDYYKEQGFVNVEETLYIGYRDGKWELIIDF